MTNSIRISLTPDELRWLVEHLGKGKPIPQSAALRRKLIAKAVDAGVFEVEVKP